VAWSVCQDLDVSCKTAGPIELPFGMWICGDPRNRALDGDPGGEGTEGNEEGQKG